MKTIAKILAVLLLAVFLESGADARTKIVDGVAVPLTQAEEDAKDAEEAAWASGQTARTAAAARDTEMADTIPTQTIGSNPAITLAQARAMSMAEWSTWWAANVTTAAQAITVLKWVAFITIKKSR